MNELLLPLATALRGDGSPAVRLLAGVRPYEEYAPLLQAATAAGGFVDLDDVPADVLEDDLHQYVSELLRADTQYRRSGATVGAFAAEVARVLSEQAGERREWGEFLVAGLYTRHLLAVHPEPPGDPGTAGSLGARTPRTLPEVLELDLSAQRTGPLLREVVTVLAHARGQGMPLTVVTRLLAGPGTEAVQQALHDGRFYLRQSTDSDGTTLYRLFHQGLADHLRQRPVPGLLPRLLAALGPAGARNWQAAEPYLLRHAVEHATEAGEVAAVLGDPGFLLQLDAATLLPMLTGRLADVYRASLDTSSRVDRAALALNAVRAGMPEMADAVATVPGEPVLTWRPRWTTGRPQARPSIVRRPIAVAGGNDGDVRIWDLTTQQPIGNPMTGHRGWVYGPAIGVLDGRPIAVTGGLDATVQIWDLTTQQPIGNSMTGHIGAIYGLAVAELVTGREDERSQRVTDAFFARLTSDKNEPVVRSLALAETSAGRVAVLGGEGGRVAVMELATGRVVHEVSLDDGPALTATTYSTIAGQPVAIVSARSRKPRILDLRDGSVLAATHVFIPRPPARQERVFDVIIVDGMLMDVCGSKEDNVAHSQGRRDALRFPRLHEGPVTAVVCMYVHGRPLAFTGGEDGVVRVWEMPDMRLLDVIDVGGPVFAIEATTDGDLLVGAGGEAIAFRYAGGEA